ncbi:MAG: zinc ribbon domain-containing protein [Desulfarculaceae bacterium]|nr:zinc ribbon domain-containing protein [Desulfarculaceae bacterium]MCF8071124.1 zinc ribbon domain-containing protein [Desulfarculaceae bacterium]MCF8101273.1 zinc ribbon domain-containing protein [Desulfarculaceae bacterium]MCF8115178.1 zinc ribbon domain-containing protein [Desulfarculaceae bacterium]
MPIFTYHCPNCLSRETRVTGVDDQVVRCLVCGCDMRRPADQEALFRAYK